MPVVFVPGKGNIKFPDDMTPYQIQLAIEREILPGRKPETISAPKGPEASLSSFFGGIAEEFKAVPSATKNLIEKTIGTPGKAIESLATLGSISALPQTLASSAQRSFMSAIGAAPPPPPPAPPKPASPRLSERIDEAIGLTSPERRAEEARRAALYGPLATRSRSEMEAATARTRADLARPQFDSVLGDILYTGTSSLVQMAPGLIGSAITRTPGPAVANIAAITAGPTYQKYEERGATPQEALLGTTAETGIELATEALPLGAFVSKLGKVGFGRFLREYLGRELPSELVATITQNAVDTAIANPDKTWGEYVKELPADLASTAIATLVPGTVLATAGKGLQLASKLAGRPIEEEEVAPRAPRTPPRAPPPPADMDALVKSLGPVGSKITLQEPSGEQEYTFEGFDEDGSVVLSDADGLTFAEDPDQIAAAMKAGVADSEEGLGGIAFGMDITEGLEEEKAGEAPGTFRTTVNINGEERSIEGDLPRSVTSESPDNLKRVFSIDGSNIPLDEGIPALPAPAAKEKFTLEPLPEEEAVAPTQAYESGIAKWDFQNRNNRSESLFEGDVTTRQARAQAVADYGNRAVHGLSKAGTATQAYNDLVGILENGIDSERGGGALYTGPLDAETNTGAAVGTASGTAYFDGPFALVGRDGHVGKFTSTDQVAGILVNDALADTGVVENLRKRFPNLAVETYSNAGKLLAQTRVASSTPTATPAAPASESIAPPEVMPIDEDVGPYMQDYARFRTAEQMAQIEDDARRAASERGATSVSKEDMYKAAIAFDNARFKPFEKPKFTIEPEPLEPPAPAQMSPEDAKKLAEEEDFLARLDDDLSYISETRAENAYEGEDPETKAAYEEEISALNEAREKTLKTIASIKGKYAVPSAAQPVAAPPAPPRVVGKTDRATIPATREKVDVQYELQDLDNIRFAEDELQNRDRSRPASDAFITDFVNNFDPDGVGEDRSTDRGAPIINKDNIILSGNGRTMGLEEIYNFHPDKAEIYKESLRELGYDIEGIERPLLVRRLKSDVDERKFVTASNEPDVAALSPPEQAAQDARDILTPAVLSKYKGGDLKAAKNDAFVSAFLAEMNPQQRKNAMDDKGKVNAQTLKRIENALLYKAYGGAGRASKIFISKAMERSDDDTKTLTNSLVDVANDWIKFQQAIENGEIDKKYDITNKLLEMVGTVSDIKASGNSVSGAMRSPDMVEPMDPFVRDILLAFHDDKTFRILSRKAIAEKLRAYTEVAANQQAAPDMFGKAETPSARDIWRRVDEGEGAPQSDLYASIEAISSDLTNAPSSMDIMALAEELPPAQRVNVRASLDKILNRYDKDGKINRLLFDLEVLYTAVDNRIARDRAKRDRDRVRGFKRAMEVTYRAEREGKLKPKSAELLRWFLQKNPAIAEELAISLPSGAKADAAGNYDAAERLAIIFYSNANESTAVHEVLHHTERLMPQKIRDGIRAEWTKRIEGLMAIAEKNNNTNMRDVLGTIVQAYYGDSVARKELRDSYKSGDIPLSLYHLSNPSEFWAVNAAELVGKRAQQTGLVGAARKWLGDFIEKVKDLFGLANNSAIIKGLDAVLKEESGRTKGEMLGGGGKKIRKAAEKKAQEEIASNKQIMETLLTGTPDQMRKAVAKAQEPDDKINGEAADLQKKNRGCD